MSYFDYVTRTAGGPLLAAAIGEAAGVFWISPPSGASFMVTRPTITNLKQQQQLDSLTGEVVVRERRDFMIDRAQLTAGGVLGPGFELKVVLDDGQWLVDPAESEWGPERVTLALARQVQVRPKEMRRAGV